jgi:nitrate reductase gamma subunit
VTRPLREAMNAEFCLYVFATVDLGLAIGRLFRVRYEELSGFVRAVDDNPLFFFLVANVVTGVITMTIDANHSSAIWAFGAVLLVFWVSSIATLFLAGKRVARI